MKRVKLTLSQIIEWFDSDSVDQCAHYSMSNISPDHSAIGGTDAGDPRSIHNGSGKLSVSVISPHASTSL